MIEEQQAGEPQSPPQDDSEEDEAQPGLEQAQAEAAEDRQEEGGYQ